MDVDLTAARAAGFRYAVMVVTKFHGLAFEELERAFAGVMVREDQDGAHFDPRTVATKVALSGSNGAYLPLVVDLEESTMSWLDVAAKGKDAFNNVASSVTDIKASCSQMLTYFGSGARPSMRGLALLHAAARSDRVYQRRPGGEWSLFCRGAKESRADFHLRLVRYEADEPRAQLHLPKPVFAALLHGDVPVPDGSSVYAVFRESATQTLAASDLLATPA